MAFTAAEATGIPDIEMINCSMRCIGHVEAITDISTLERHVGWAYSSSHKHQNLCKA